MKGGGRNWKKPDNREQVVQQQVESIAESAKKFTFGVDWKELPDGQAFEFLIIERSAEIMDKYAQEHNLNNVLQNHVFKIATKDEDRKFGTDFFAYQVPMDVTLDFEGKDKMDVLKGEINLDQNDKNDVNYVDSGYRVKFGMRHGNARHDFATPAEQANPRIAKNVLVIGFVRTNGLKIDREKFPYVVKRFEKRFEDIINDGQDIYFAELDRQKKADRQKNDHQRRKSTTLSAAAMPAAS
jgi:hypothetical protein